MLTKRSVRGAEHDRLSVRRVSVGVGPGLLALQQRRSIGQPLLRDQTLEGGYPVVIVLRAVVGLALFLSSRSAKIFRITFLVS